MVGGHTTGSLRAATLEPAARPPAAPSAPHEGNASSASSLAAGPVPGVRLVLARGFQLLVDGGLVEIPHSSERLLAFLALTARPVFRGYVAGILWLDRSEERALANLRSALWRLRGAGADVVATSGDRLALAPQVDVDVRGITVWARAAERAAEIEPERLDQLLAAHDLLADWYDDWAVVERERFRNVRLHALETCCRRLAEAGEPARAIEAGLAAVTEEPLRESAQRALIAAHLTEGNVGEALRQYASFRDLMGRELGLAPSPLLEALVGPYRRAARVVTGR